MFVFKLSGIQKKQQLVKKGIENTAIKSKTCYALKVENHGNYIIYKTTIMLWGS